MPHSQEFLNDRLNNIPDSDLSDALSTTWEQQVDVSLAAAIENIYADSLSLADISGYIDSKIEFDYENYYNARCNAMKNIADISSGDVVDYSSLLVIETSYLTQQSYRISKCIEYKWEETCRICYDILEQYNIALKYYNTIKDNITKYNYSDAEKNYDISKNNVITNERKVWYENNELNKITTTANILQVIYFILLLILISVLVYKNIWRDYINVIIVICFIIWPFISGIIINNIIKFIRYINSLFPNDAYLNLN